MTKPVLTILLNDQLLSCLTAVETLVQPLGFRLEHPISGKITTWTSEGVQREVLREAFAEEAVENVQFWKSSCDDLFVSWSPTSSGFRFSFHLNGVPMESRIALANTLVRTVLTDLRHQFCDQCAFTIEFE